MGSNTTPDGLSSKKIVIQGWKFDFWKQMKLNCGAKRHHYSMFNVGRSMFDVHLLNQLRMA